MQLIPQLVKQKHNHEAKRAQKWNPESSSPGQSRRPRPLGIRASVAGAAAAGVLEPALLLHRRHQGPSKSAPNPVKFASDSAPLQFGASEEPVVRGGGRDCSPVSDAGSGDEPRSRTEGRGATDRAHSSMWCGGNEPTYCTLRPTLRTRPSTRLSQIDH